MDHFLFPRPCVYESLGCLDRSFSLSIGLLVTRAARTMFKAGGPVITDDYIWDPLSGKMAFQFPDASAGLWSGRQSISQKLEK